MPRGLSKSVKHNLPLHKGEDYTGKKIGQWTVLGFHSYVSRRTSGAYRWLCKCSCGTEKALLTATLLYGRSSMCLTCANNKGSGDSNPNWKGHGAVPGVVLQRIRMSVVKRAKGRNLPVTVDCEYLNKLWEEQDGICVYSGRALTIGKDASIDRIDSSKGYIPRNVQWVHIDINRAKWEQSEESFLEMCRQVEKHTRTMPVK